MSKKWFSKRCRSVAIFYFKHYKGLDLLIATLLTVAIFIAAFYWEFDVFTSQDRINLYSALITVEGVFLGFAITAVTILVSVAGHEALSTFALFGKLKDMSDTFYRAIWVLLLAIIVSSFAVFIDRAKAIPNIVMEVSVSWLSIYSLLCLHKCIWLLRIVSNKHVKQIEASAKSKAESNPARLSTEKTEVE